MVRCAIAAVAMPSPLLFDADAAPAGMLAVARALGDIAMKQFVVSTPHVSERVLDTADEFFIIACDGVRCRSGVAWPRCDQLWRSSRVTSVHRPACGCPPYRSGTWFKIKKQSILYDPLRMSRRRAVHW